MSFMGRSKENPFLRTLLALSLAGCTAVSRDQKADPTEALNYGATPTPLAPVALRVTTTVILTLVILIQLVPLLQELLKLSKMRKNFFQAVVGNCVYLKLLKKILWKFRTKERTLSMLFLFRLVMTTEKKWKLQSEISLVGCLELFLGSIFLFLT